MLKFYKKDDKMEFLEFVEQLGYLGWFTLGLALILLEILIPGIYLLWFGLSAFVMGGIVSFVTLSGVELCVLFAVISAIFAAIGWYIYSKVIKKSQVPEKYKNLNDMAGSYVGKVYNLTEDVVDGRSKAKVGDTFWLVETEDNLKKGDKVKIIGVDNGVILKAKKYK